MVHADASPSAFHRILRCTASLEACRGIEDSASLYAAEGSMLHEVSAECLQKDIAPETLVGNVYSFDGQDLTFTAEQVPLVYFYIDYVRDTLTSIAQTGKVATPIIEQRVDFAKTIDYPSAFGHSDCIITAGDELWVIDAKFGSKPVDAKDNEQAQAYALGVLETFGFMGEFETIHISIVMPKNRRVSEWTTTRKSVEAFGRQVRDTFAKIKIGDVTFNPGPTQCQWCRAKPLCPALRADLENDFSIVPNDQIQLACNEDLATAMQKADLHESWAKAIRAEVERRLLRGTPISGFKLVSGRKGPRKWSNEAAVRDALKSMRLKQDQMFSYSLISPTKAEELFRSQAIGPRQWNALQALVTQADARPSVAPLSDVRPALQLIQDFENLGDAQI